MAQKGGETTVQAGRTESVTQSRVLGSNSNCGSSDVQHSTATLSFGNFSSAVTVSTPKTASHKEELPAMSSSLTVSVELVKSAMHFNPTLT